MKPQFIQIKGLNLAYYTKNDDREHTIFFVHGNSASSLTWQKQVNDLRFHSYRLVVLDLPAHGLSDASTRPLQDYNAIEIGHYLAKFVETMANGNPYIVVSISLGTNMVAEALAHDFTPKGLVFIGPCLIAPDIPVSAILQPDNHSHVIFMDDPDEADVRQYVREMHFVGRPEDLQAYLTSFAQVQAPFRSAFGQSVAKQVYSDEIGLINQSGIPVLVCMGAEERVVNIGYLDGTLSHLWRNEVIRLPEAGHLVNIDQPGTLNPMLEEFAADVFSH